jgi:hypothetical protein
MVLSVQLLVVDTKPETLLWPRIFDVLCREAVHVGTVQADSWLALSPSLLLAAQRHRRAGLPGLPHLRYGI